MRCHGYMILPTRFKRQLKKQFGVNGWDQPRDLPLRTIVKDFVPEDTIWSPKVARKVLRDLKRMREHGVYAMDIKPDNFKAGLLVDFSIAMTLPHFLFDIKPKHMVRRYKNEDLIDFDVMVRELGIRTSIRAFGNLNTRKKLRSYHKWLVGDSDDD